MRHLRTTITSILIGTLVLGGFGLAQAHARGGMTPWMRAPAAATALLGARVATLPQLARLPVGTTVEFAFHDGDPTAGASAITTLTITVGVDSEAAFGTSFAAARDEAAAWEEAFLVVTVGEQTRTVVLPDDDAEPAIRGLHRDAGWPPTAMGMSDGDSIVVTLYAGEPDAGGTVIETLSFVYGVDSEIGFRSALQAAAGDADAAVVVTSPRSVTLDLGVMRERATDGYGRVDARGAAAGPFGRLDAPRRLLPGRAR